MLWEGYRQPEMEHLFADENLVRLWWRIEVALVETLADFDRIPRSVADELRAFDLTPEHVRMVLMASRHWRATGNIIMAFVALLEDWVGEAGAYLHWGATSQDITDTALILQLKEATYLFQMELTRLLAVIIAVTERTKAIPTLARTNGQHAEPITMGFKWAMTIPEFDRHRQRLLAMSPRISSGQMTGSVGTCAAWEPDGWHIGDAVNRRLGLTMPVAAWHGIRDTQAEYVSWIMGVMASVERMAMDVYLLQMSEVGELQEAHESESVGSSSMPHKINPFSSNMIRSMAQMARTQGSGIWDAVQVMHEREAGRNRREYVAIAQTSIWGYSALRCLTDLLAGMRINTDQVKANLVMAEDHMVSQGVMMVLAEHLGRQAAHHQVREWIQASTSKNFLSYALKQMEAMGIKGVINDPRLSPDYYVSIAERRTEAILEWARSQPWWQSTSEQISMDTEGTISHRP